MFLRKLVPAKSYRCSKLATLWDALYVHNLGHPHVVNDEMSTAGNKSKNANFTFTVHCHCSEHVLVHSQSDCLCVIMAVCLYTTQDKRHSHYWGGVISSKCDCLQSSFPVHAGDNVIFFLRGLTTWKWLLFLFLSDMCCHMLPLMKKRVFMYIIIYYNFANKLFTKPACVIVILNMNPFKNIFKTVISVFQFNNDMTYMIFLFNKNHK